MTVLLPEKRPDDMSSRAKKSVHSFAVDSDDSGKNFRDQEIFLDCMNCKPNRVVQAAFQSGAFERAYRNW
jgi:hypothetical protein